MKKNKTFLPLILITLSSCVYTEVIDVPEQKTETPFPPEMEPVVLTDTMAVTISHTADTAIVPELYGGHATMFHTHTDNSRTAVITLGTESFGITNLADVDSIFVRVVE